MTTNYDNALDICIGLLMQGESVEECLRRFPEHAAELEADLWPMVDSVAATTAYSPSDAARNRARNLMQVAIAEEVAEDVETATGSPGNWTVRLREAVRSWLPQRGVPQWAAGAAAAVLVLLVGGLVTVSASSDALPGQALYPVKRTTENVSLAFTFSDSARAERHLELAERRADEIATISGDADSALVSTVTRDLQEHVASASNIILDIESESAASELTEHLRSSSYTALLTLQEAPGSEQSLKEAGDAYGEAIEQTAARQGDAYVAAPPGTLRMQVTDPPPPGVDRLFLGFAKVEVYIPAGDNSHWITILDSSRRLDLIRSANSPIVLAQAEIESGSFSRIRITLDSSSIVIGGVTQPVTLQEQAIELKRPFVIREDDLTTLTIDIDSAASLSTLSGGGYAFSPVVKVLSSQPPPASATPTTTPNPSVTPTQQAALEISGKVSVLGPSLISVDGFEIALVPDTLVDGTVQDGSRVTIEALEGASGTLIASVIRVGEPPAAGSTPTNTPNPTTTSEVRTVVEGLVESVGVNQWTVDGREVSVTNDTVIGLGAALGLRVRVEGVLESDGSLRATSIVLAPLIGPSPTPTPVSLPSPTPSPEPGSTATPTATPLPTPTPGAVGVEVTGRILSIVDATWLVGDREVLVTSSTIVEGVPLVGKTVTVTGILADDGTIIAERITFSSFTATATPTATASSAPTSTATATPTTSPSPTPTSILDDILDTPTPTPTPEPATATPTATPTTEPTAEPTATPSPTPSPTPTPSVVTIEGQVTNLTAGVEFTIGSTTVVITSSTEIDGVLVAGVTVNVTGVLDGGVLEADTITVL